jgi:hypothetical protein
MNDIRRICQSLTGLQRRVGALLASSTVPSALLAADPPLPPGWREHPRPLPAHTHTVVAAAVPNWLITLIAVGVALLASALAVLVRRSRVARRAQRRTPQAGLRLRATRLVPQKRGSRNV